MRVGGCLIIPPPPPRRPLLLTPPRATHTHTHTHDAESKLPKGLVQRRTFLRHAQALQDLESIQPAVVHAGFPDEHGMWRARAGTTALEFSIPFEGADALAAPAPAPESAYKEQLAGSFWHPRLGGVRYVVCG